jgi:hypothetical protein
LIAAFHAFDCRFAGLLLQKRCQVLCGWLLLPVQQALQDGSNERTDANAACVCKPR